MVRASVIHPKTFLSDLLINLGEAPVASPTADEVRTSASDLSPRIIAAGRRVSKRRRIRQSQREELLPVYDQRPCRWIDPNRHLFNLSLVTTADGAAASEAESRASRGVHGWRTSEGTRAAGRRCCAVAVRVDAFKSQL
jgi:hypothetical protein